MGVHQQPGIVGLPVWNSTGVGAGNVGQFQGELDPRRRGFRVADNAAPCVGSPAVFHQQRRRRVLPHLVPPQAQQAHSNQQRRPDGNPQQAAGEGRHRRRARQEQQRQRVGVVPPVGQGHSRQPGRRQRG